jgi:ABC-2 type transport system ATP-binding protein
MSEETAIKVENVSKTFKLPHEKNSSIKNAIVHFTRSNKSYELQTALDNVSFEIKKGEFFGIVGRKLLAGIYAPTSGSIHVKGKLTPFIELGVGFNPELTGRENVFLNGALLGFNRKEMESMYDDIVEFAEIHRFMDQKLKNYSSGMQVRLAFSIAIRAKTEILVLDEVLAVGDAAFQKKCLDHFSLLKSAKQTVVFVSHDMESVRKYCDRVVWIDGGRVKENGSAKDVIPKYMEIFVTNENTGHFKKTAQGIPLGISSAVDIDDTTLEIQGVGLEVFNKKIATLGNEDKPLTVILRIRALKNVKEAIPGVIVTNDLGEFITATNTKWGNTSRLKNLKKGKVYEVQFSIPNIFERGKYKVSVNVVSEELNVFYAWSNQACTLESTKPYHTGGKVNPKVDVRVSEL